MLKKKRYQEQLVEKTDKQLDTVEQLVHDLEFAQVEMQVTNEEFTSMFTFEFIMLIVFTGFGQS